VEYAGQLEANIEIFVVADDFPVTASGLAQTLLRPKRQLVGLKAILYRIIHCLEKGDRFAVIAVASFYAAT